MITKNASPRGLHFFFLLRALRVRGVNEQNRPHGVILLIPSGRRGVARLKHGESFALQNHEAPLQDFGLNKHFPIVGKRLLSRSFLIILGRKLLRAGADCLPQPLPQADGAF